MRARQADNHALGGTSSYQVTPAGLIDAEDAHLRSHAHLGGHGVTGATPRRQVASHCLDAKATIRMVYEP